jgi:hypothetical protein
VAPAGGGATEFTRETGVSGVGTGTFDHLELVLTNLDQSYLLRAALGADVVAAVGTVP